MAEMIYTQVLCYRIINCGKNNYGQNIIMCLFQYDSEILYWVTTDKSSAVKTLEEGKTYDLIWEWKDKKRGVISKVKILEEAISA